MAGFGRNNDVDSATAEALGASAKVKTGVRIGALAGNTNKVYIGLNDPAVTSSTGIELPAGVSLSFDVGMFQDSPGERGDIADIYVIGGADNQGVWYYWY